MRLYILPRTVTAVLLCSLAGISARAQTPADNGNADLAAAVRDLQAQVRELRAVVSELRAEAAHYQQETQRLRQQFELAGSAPHPAAGGNETAQSASATIEQRLANLQDEQQLLQAKVDEQHQVKVESASKYRVRLSGIVLLNAFSNRGAVDSIDVPTLALSRGPLESGGSVGGSLRQSLLGLEVFGPNLAGARTSADLQLDFAGGFQQESNGAVLGLVRLRTGALRLDWNRVSIVAGQDTLFLAPESPTSLATLAVPALAYSGNLWGWVPQIRAQYSFQTSEQSRLTLQTGVLDALAGESPVSSSLRFPSAGERSRTPATGARVAWSRKAFGRDFTLGAAGYYSKQNWGFGRNVHSWAAMSDWAFPFTSWMRLSGEFYRGNALGGFGGGIGRSVLLGGDLANPITSVRALRTIGGWTQLKIIPAPKLEFNAAAGQDNPFAHQIRQFVYAQSDNNPLWFRNRTEFVNLVYRPRSDLLFSVEFRHLRTFDVPTGADSANHVNLAMGFLF